MSQYAPQGQYGYPQGAQGSQGGYDDLAAQQQYHQAQPGYNQDPSAQGQYQANAGQEPTGYEQQQPDADEGSQHPGASEHPQSQNNAAKEGKKAPNARPGLALAKGNKAAKTVQKHVPKPQHAHSRFAQDPHHHKQMQHFHKIAQHGVTEEHIQSLVHLGTFALATLAHNSGMTAGHAEEDSEEEQGAEEEHPQQ